MQLINLTPHDIHLHLAGGEVRTIPKSGKFARAEEKKQEVGSVDGIPLLKISYGSVNDLPPQAEGVAYIVSQITAVAAKSLNRIEDILIVAETVRDDNGRIVGAKALAQV